MKQIYILAGANGSGKSTVARVLLPNENMAFVNPGHRNGCAWQRGNNGNVKGALRRFHGGRMQDIVEKFTRLANTAVHLAQEKNRRKGIPNVYVLNGVIVWQMPDGTITTTRPKWKSMDNEGASKPAPAT